MFVRHGRKRSHHTYDIPDCIFDPESPINILGIPPLGAYFKDSATVHNPFDDDGTTIKSGATKSHLVWDHGKHERHFMHGASYMPELHLYVGHGYFNAFCTRIRKSLGEKVNFAFSSAYSIDPQFKTEDKVSTKPAVIPYDTGKLEEEPLHEWYNPIVNNSGAAKFNSKNVTPTSLLVCAWVSHCWS